MIISLDTECTGPDFWHGCKPFFVSTCTPDGADPCWDFPVDPKCRAVHISPKKLASLQAYIESADTIVFHNAKFDIRALSTIGIPPDVFWNKEIHDTHIASHVLWSGESHALKDLCVLHLNYPDTDEDALIEASKKARTLARTLEFDIATHKHRHFPGLPKTTHWEKLDYWLPAAVARHKGYPADHPWYTVCSEYGANDAARTVLLWELLEKLIHHEKLWDHYVVRRNMLQVVYEMEESGLYMRPEAYEEEHTRYTEYMLQSQRVCRDIANNPELNLNSHPQVRKFVFEECGLESVGKTKGGADSLDADSLDLLLNKAKPKSVAHRFLTHLQRYRKVDKCLDFLDSYLAYSVDHIIHPGLNIPGTGTTRLASSNPNGQNVGRQEKYNLRRAFGPQHGRILLSIDYVNIELRMLAYASGETELIKAFERGESVHMNFGWVVCPWAIMNCPRSLSDLQYSKMKAELSKDEIKSLEEKFKETDQYHWLKNGDFALTYGATRTTADTTYHIDGAYDKIRSYFTHLDEFMSERVREAYRTHIVYTLGGYKLQIPYGREYTTAVDYYCQGSAGWVMNLAMLNCWDFLQKVNDRYSGYNGRMLIQIHDELLFDLPAKHRANQEVIKTIRKCMEIPGTELGVPTPTEAKVFPVNWANGVSLDEYLNRQ